MKSEAGLAKERLTEHHSGGRGHVGRLDSRLGGDERLLQRRADADTNDDLVSDPVTRRGVETECVNEAATDGCDTRADDKVGLGIAKPLNDKT